MMRHAALYQAILTELRIPGSRLPLFSGAVAAAFALLSLISGDLLNLSCVGFELIFPLFTAIAVGEWGRTRSDANYDVIAASSQSLFRWVLARYLAVWSVCGCSAICSMAAVFFLRREMAAGELLGMYCPTAFLFSSLAVLVGLLHPREHTAALTCGVAWLLSLMLRSLLRLPGVAYFYPFLRFAGGYDEIWLVSKGILCLMGLGLWGGVYWVCQRTP